MEKDSLKKAILCLVLIPVVLIASLVTSGIVWAVVAGGSGGSVELTITFGVVLAVYSVLTWRYLKKTK